MLGASTYVGWVAAQIVVVPTVLFIMSGLIGFGAAILWVAQGTFLTKNSTKETLGRNSGIFFGFYQMNQVIGNLIAAAILSRNHSNTQNPAPLFILFTVTSAISCLAFFLIKSAPKDQTMIEPPLYHVNILTRITDMWRTLKDRNFLLLVLIIAYSGFSTSFFSGSFTKELGRFLLNYVMIFFGVADALGSFLFGKVIDVLGRKPILILATAMVMVSTILLLAINREILQQRTTFYYICAVMFGLGDAGVFTVLYATVGNLFASRVETAFGTFRLVQALTTGIAFVVFLYVEDFSFQILMLDTLLLAGLLGFLFLDFFFSPVDSKSDTAEVRPRNVR
jgi:MFS family permease